MLLLIAVAVLSAIFGELRDAIAIFIVIVIIGAVEAVAEVARQGRCGRCGAQRSQRARAAAGVAEAIPVGDLVIGDVLLVEAGTLVAADVRVVSADGLAADESRLTGEPPSAAKGPEPVPAGTPLAERSSVMHAGTAVVAGAGEGVVVALGDDTEIGDSGGSSRRRRSRQPRCRTRWPNWRAALIVAVTACVLVPLLGVLRGQPAREMLLSGLTLAFATIPEELPILVTALVALGGLRLAQHGVLLRRLRAAEAVGAMTVLLAEEDRDADREPVGDRGRLRGPRARAGHRGGGARGGRRAGPRGPRAGRGDRRARRGRRPARFPFDPVRRRESAAWREGDGARAMSREPRRRCSRRVRCPTPRRRRCSTT